LLEIKLHCGGELPARLKISGIRAEKAPEIETSPTSTRQDVQLYNAKHPFRHKSTCSPALPYPSANLFSRCSLDDYVKCMKKRWFTQQ
uniref:CHCH domain-containing protein n=1 Tax=Gongylonema pulchrum TaxID=637853 RepID=A0A183EJY6_9BILA